MNQVVGVLKFMGAFAMTVFLIMTIFNLKMQDGVEKALTITITSLLVGIYVYYLISTGIWNIKGRIYKINILVIIGILIHLFLIIGVLYASYTRLPGRVFIVNCIASTVGLTMSVYDTNQLCKSFKIRKSVTV